MYEDSDRIDEVKVKKIIGIYFPCKFADSYQEVLAKVFVDCDEHNLNPEPTVEVLIKTQNHWFSLMV